MASKIMKNMDNNLMRNSRFTKKIVKLILMHWKKADSWAKPSHYQLKVYIYRGYPGMAFSMTVYSMTICMTVCRPFWV